MIKKSAPTQFVVFLICVAWLTPVLAAPHCLWKVSGETNAVYLLGSIHFLKNEFYPLPEPIESAFDRAQIVVFETDIAELGNSGTQMKMLTQGICPPDKTIRDFVSEETYASFKKHLGGQAVAFDRFRPWFAAVALMALEIQKLGFDAEQGVDRYFHAKALKAKKKIAGLETVQFQMDLFATLSAKDQEQFLLESLTETSQMKTMFEDIVQAWQMGDEAKLETLLLTAMKEYPELERKFLTDRNRAWVPQIEAYLAGPGEVLVVVGAGHLVGKDSIVELLRQKGRKVEQQESASP